MKKALYPGKRSVVDGCAAVAWVETRASSAAMSYPITPSTPMGVAYQAAVSNGEKNVWGETLAFFEPESEHSSASACEGYALTGGRVTNFTSGQGLILMKEVLYVIAGKRLPVVFHIGARTLSVQSLSIHCGHDDIMGVMDCGWGMLFACNVQQAADFALIARKTAEEAHTPFVNVQDGFYTTHTMECAYLPEAELVKAYLKPADQALVSLMDPENPVMSGPVQGQDTYMTSKIAQRQFYKNIKKILLSNMEEYYKLTGRAYDLIERHQMDDAEYAIVGMGSFMETAKATVNALREKHDVKVGVVIVHAFRPFPGEELVAALKNVKVLSVLERMDDSNSPENPLSRALKSAFADASWGATNFEKIDRIPVIQQGAAGLSGLEVRVEDFLAVVDNMQQAERGKIHYCLGVNHPDALKRTKSIALQRKNYFALKGYSIGGLGSITTNKILATLCSELFNFHVQAYPKYGSEKKGMPTAFFLALSSEHILPHQELHQVHCIVINNPAIVHQINPLDGAIKNACVFLETNHKNPSDIWKTLPHAMQKTIRDKKLRLFGLSTTEIAEETARAPEMTIIMRGIIFVGAFFKMTTLLSEHKITESNCFDLIEDVLRRYFGGKSEQIIKENLTCIKRGFHEVIEIPQTLSQEI